MAGHCPSRRSSGSAAQDKSPGWGTERLALEALGSEATHPPSSNRADPHWGDTGALEITAGSASTSANRGSGLSIKSRLQTNEIEATNMPCGGPNRPRFAGAIATLAAFALVPTPTTTSSEPPNRARRSAGRLRRSHD